MLVLSVREKILTKLKLQHVDSMSLTTLICLMKIEIFFNILQLEAKKKNSLSNKNVNLRKSNKDKVKTSIQQLRLHILLLLYLNQMDYQTLNKG